MSTQMLQSILEQPDAFRRLLAAGLRAEALVAAFRERNIRKVWIVGSGTSLYAAMIAARSWEQELGIDCETASSLEFLEEPGALLLGSSTMVLAISQSGASLILLEGIKHAKAAGALTAVVTAEPKAPIALVADFVIETHTGPETNMGKTKGFTTTAFAAVLLGRRIAMRESSGADAALRTRYQGLPEAFARTIEAARAVSGEWARKFQRADALFVVGAGSQVPAALEGALKILEVAKMPVISKELEEMMHGPVNGVGVDTGVVLAADRIGQPQRLAALVEGIRLIGVGFVGIATDQSIADQCGASDLVLPPADDEAVRAVLGVIPFQLLAHDLAVARGVSVDAARYPQLYPVFASKSIYQRAGERSSTERRANR